MSIWTLSKSVVPGRPQQKISKGRIRELPAEIKVAVVIATNETERIDRLDMTIIEAELQRVPARGPGHIVHCLVSPPVRDTLEPVSVSPVRLLIPNRLRAGH